MYKSWIGLFMLSVLLAGAPRLTAQVEPSFPSMGTVTGSLVNIRARPGTSFENLGSFNQGIRLMVVSRLEDWYEVRLPDTVHGWVTVDTLDENNVVQKEPCRLYAGPGLVFSSFANAAKGTKLAVVEVLENWRRVKAPPEATAWVNAAYVALDQPPLPPAPPCPSRRRSRRPPSRSQPCS